MHHVLADGKLYKVHVKVEKPPIYENACAAFRLNPKSVVFTYGDTIYNPNDLPLGEDIIAHEMVHVEQQGGNDKGAQVWWSKFLQDPEFRLSQELEAYAKQYNFICKHMTQNKQVRFNLLKRYAEILSGPLYGNCVGFHKAITAIKEEAQKYA